MKKEKSLNYVDFMFQQNFMYKQGTIMQKPHETRFLFLASFLHIALHLFLWYLNTSLGTYLLFKQYSRVLFQNNFLP